MITSHLGNNNCDTSRVDDRLDKLEETVTGFDEAINTQHLTTKKLDAIDANISNLTTAGIVTDNIQGGAITGDSLAITGSVKAKNFEISDPVIVTHVTSETADIGNLDVTDMTGINGNFENLTVSNLMTIPDSSLEYKNLSVTNIATINKLNLTDPHIVEVITEHSAATNFDVQNIVMDKDGKMSKADGTSVISFTEGGTKFGDTNNNVILAGKNRPTWNDLLLATISDIQTGLVTPVYKGVLNYYNELPTLNNALGDLYVIKHLVISGKEGIGHAQWNGKAWDSYLIYELDYFTNTLFDQEIDGKKTFLQPIDGSIDKAVHHTAESIPADADLNTYVTEEYEGTLFYGTAGTIVGLPVDVVGNFGLAIKKTAPSTVSQTISYIENDKVVTASRIIQSNKNVLADWTRLVNTEELAQLETDMLNAIQDVIDGVTPVIKVAEGCVDTKGNKLATIKDVKTASWVGTKARFDAEKEITDVDNKDYIATGTLINLTDDVNDSLNVSSEVTIGDKNPVTSDAVAKIIEEVKASLSASMPIGSVTSFAGETAPSGYLICDGTELRDIDYPELSALIKGKYGAAASSDYFKLPNLKGRYVLGYDDTNALEPLGKSIEEQLPNIVGYNGWQSEQTYKNGPYSAGVTKYASVGASNASRPILLFNANKTWDAKTDKTIDNPAYKDPVDGKPVNVRPNSVVMNYIIKAK